MAECTKITVYGLSPEASNRLDGAIEAVLDIPTGFALRLSKDVERLSLLNKISTEGVLGFSLPYTPTNDAVFVDFATPLTVDNTIVFYTVSVVVADHGIRFDRLLVKGKNEQSKTWELELRRSPDHWIELASQVKINQLNYGTAVMSVASITGTWAFPVFNGSYTDPSSGQRPVYWPLVDYGGWCDLSEPPQGAEGNYKSVAVEDFRPFLSLPFIVINGFCQIGWTLEGVIFDTDWMKRLWVYALRQDYYIASKRGGRFTARRFVRKHWQNSIGDYFSLDEIIETYPGLTIPGFFAGIKNVPNVSLQYRFQMQGEFHNDRALPFVAVFGVYEMDNHVSTPDFTGELLSTETLIVEFAPNEKKMVIFDQEVILKPGQRGAIHIAVTPTSTPGFFIEPGVHVTVRPSNMSLMSDDFPVISECVSGETSVLDWLKAIVHLVNGRLETDWETKTLTLHPNKRSDVFGDIVPGFLLDEDVAIDISEQIVVDSIQIKPVRPDLKRYTSLEFAKTTDAYIGSLNLTQPAHSRKLVNGVDLPDETEIDANPILEPTLEGQPNGIASGNGNRNPLPYLPRLWDNTDGQRSFAISPRILYAFGVVQQINPEPVQAANEFTSFFFDTVPNPTDTGLVTDFGYATQLPTWEMTPAPTVAGNVVFGTEEFDLFVNFYLGYTQDARGGTLLDLLLFMKMKDYVGYDFRRLFAFKYNGIPMRVPMVGIRDFASCSDIPTPVTFFASPSETKCCDLPCGCRFSTCDYYQDMGIFMRQATLNSLKLASFVVDGIELVTAPISFGLLKMVDIGGQQYVMNLIDTLNSVGAPYFSFNLSTRTHPEKGKRFFTLKRPACIPFKIIIELSGAEIYMYTHEVQQTKWFSAGWEDFGYGSEFYGEPIDCRTTTEY